MSTLRLLVHLNRFRAGLYLFEIVLVAVGFVAIVILPGVLLRVAFDTLAGNTPEMIWNVLALLTAIQIGYVGTWMLHVWVDSLSYGSTSTLLGYNMLDHVLQKPGARSLDVSPGEAVGRFRHDILSFTALPGMVSEGVSAIFEPIFLIPLLIIMALVSVPFTLISLVPIVLMKKQSTKRRETYRRRS